MKRIICLTLGLIMLVAIVIPITSYAIDPYQDHHAI